MYKETSEDLFLQNNVDGVAVVLVLSLLFIDVQSLSDMPLFIDSFIRSRFRFLFSEHFSLYICKCSEFFFGGGGEMHNYSCLRWNFRAASSGRGRFSATRPAVSYPPRYSSAKLLYYGACLDFVWPVLGSGHILPDLDKSVGNVSNLKVGM